MDDLALVRASVATAKGMVFVHVDASPPMSLDEWLGDIIGELGALEPSDLHELPVERHEMRANWKLFVRTTSMAITCGICTLGASGGSITADRDGGPRDGIGSSMSRRRSRERSLIGRSPVCRCSRRLRRTVSAPS
jgi:hypothetical protein